ncbi:hypothetical protein AVEN_23337-1 [Araneus ventricosus]|uniref:Uncharacterized protein n=1 Tax=Araneus ventricosus TaxID=182803 RepID=A0A4Y2FRX3_ARAVE|nr:hypothetical protein AVEN_23337-1 [Araneus ventricosus]
MHVFYQPKPRHIKTEPAKCRCVTCREIGLSDTVSGKQKYQIHENDTNQKYQVLGNSSGIRLIPLGYRLCRVRLRAADTKYQHDKKYQYDALIDTLDQFLVGMALRFRQFY